ncbi:hypothetical protein ACWEPC_19660 [Nonomuraea sp. NPDC004297]
MTLIYDVHTDPRRNSTLTGSVHYRDTDNYGFTEGPEFGLQIIVDAWQEHSHYGAASVSAPTEAEFKELYQLVLKRPEFARRAAGIIVSFDLDEDEEDGRRSALFTIEVSDPRYLDHFAEAKYFQMA